MRLLPIFLILILASCSYNEDSRPASTWPEYDSLIKDTIMQPVNGFTANIKGLESITTLLKPVAILSVPAFTAEVKSYNLEYSPGGNLYLQIMAGKTEAIRTYRYIVTRGTITETINILQSPYVRIDTTKPGPDSLHLFGYKAQPDTSITKILKPF